MCAGAAKRYLELRPDIDSIEALSTEREALWTRVDKATFLTQDEKRAAVGYGPIDGGDDLASKHNPYHDELGRFTTADGDAGGLVHPAATGRRPPRPPPPRPPRRREPPPPGIGHNRPPRDPPPPEAIQRAINDHRFIHDLSGSDVVAYAPGLPEGSQFGVNSTARSYDQAEDRAAANEMRETLLDRYPDVMQTENIGRIPNNALYHAETTLLLRAARANGGSLAGMEFEVHVDGQIVCRPCQRILPYVGLELGNPTVTFVDRSGIRRTMRDGVWTRVGQ